MRFKSLKKGFNGPDLKNCTRSFCINIGIQILESTHSFFINDSEAQSRQYPPNTGRKLNVVLIFILGSLFFCSIFRKKKKEGKWIPVICDQQFGVTAIGDAAIPEDTVICHLQLFAVILLIAFAKLAIQTCCCQTPHPYSVSFLKPLHLAPHFRYHPCDLMPKVQTCHSQHWLTLTVLINQYIYW